MRSPQRTWSWWACDKYDDQIQASLAMEKDQWRKIEAVFQAALEQTPDDRRSFLESVCAGDVELRCRVELLLENEQRAGSFLETSVIDDGLRTIPLAVREFGPYQVTGALGAGGMGEVYRARDEKLGRDVALKTLPLRFAGHAEKLARLRREARTLASLNHPNIAAIYGLEESRDVDCLVLELVEGEMLCGPTPIPRALDCAHQIAGALQAAHAKGIIHRDLKPGNVKITPEGRVKLLDFGLAKAIWEAQGTGGEAKPAFAASTSTTSEYIAGTPGYMSPEQARGGQVDHRSDIWSFGCLLYELLSGRHAFETGAGEPDWHALPAKTPAKIRALLRRCLQKDPQRRLQDIADARRTIEHVQRGWKVWNIATIAAGTVGIIAIGAAIWFNSSARPPDNSAWVQLTSFPDPVSQPALSPDGRVLAFIRSPSTFFAVGEIYIKRLPDGEAIQLTHDHQKKADPAFSPDGKRIAYTVVDPQFNWDTWVVPGQGGEPQLWIRNAAHAVWSGSAKILFSTMRPNPHMGIVTADENRGGEREVYFPVDNRAMAHRSQVSPDGKWVLLAELGGYGNWEPCRVLPMDGHSRGHPVGPPAPCTFGAWSRDGRWIYLTSKAGGLYHIWRQSFPNGKPEQVTSGLTQEEGVAMSPDGRSFVTTVALESSSLWIHDAAGERQISVLEGNAAYPRFTPDGKKLVYRTVKAVPRFGTNRDPGEVWITDLISGHSDRVAPGFQPLDFEISPDGLQVVMEAPDSEGKPRLWLAPLERRARPRMIPNVEGRKALFHPNGEIFFRRSEGAAAFVYRVRPDGSGLRKALNVPIFSPSRITPDGRWIEAWAPLSADKPSAVQIFPLESGSPVIIGSNTLFEWSRTGDCVWISGGAVPDGATYIVPLAKGNLLPRIPADGFHSEQEIARLPGARKLDAMGAPGPTRDVYAFERRTVQRNLYRIPIP